MSDFYDCPQCVGRGWSDWGGDPCTRCGGHGKVVSLCPCMVSTSGYVYRQHLPNCSILELENRHMSSWTEAEFEEYNRMTGQREAKP